ncbi:hypothetical protein V2G26_020469 [Clonostachys chloroleuca]
MRTLNHPHAHEHARTQDRRKHLPILVCSALLRISLLFALQPPGPHHILRVRRSRGRLLAIRSAATIHANRQDDWLTQFGGRHQQPPTSPDGGFISRRWLILAHADHLF